MRSDASNYHIYRVGVGDLDGILSDYTDDSIMISPDVEFPGICGHSVSAVS